jgi:hypothetical protein
MVLLEAQQSLVSLTMDTRGDGEGSLNPLVDADAQASRDYESAAKLGTKEAWSAFLTKHQTGFYADLARGQHAKLVSNAPDSAAKPERQKPIKSASPPPPDPEQKKRKLGRARPTSYLHKNDVLQAFCADKVDSCQKAKAPLCVPKT